MSLVLPEDPSDSPRKPATNRPVYRQVPALARMRGIDIWRILTTDIAASRITEDCQTPGRLHLVTSQWVDSPKSKDRK